MRARSKHIRWAFFTLAIVLALPLPLPLKSLTGLLLWVSPYMLLLSVLSQKSIVWLNILGIAALSVTLFRKRWVCRFICPAGAICDLVSGIGRSRMKPIRLSLNKYLAIFSLILALFGIPVFFITDPFNIIHMSMEVFRTGPGLPSLVKATGLLAILLLSIVLPDSWCSGICPLGGLQLLVYDLRQSISKARSPVKVRADGRRLFLAGMTGVIAGALVPQRIFASRTQIIRPPFSLPEPEFNMVCARCGNCSSACPTGIISPSSDIRSLESFLTPGIDFTESYCLPECKLCGDVCPSGAIKRFSLENKKDHIMARAVIHVADCLLQQLKECDLCKFHCRYDAIEITRIAGEQVKLPRVIENKCTGCGACKIICPVQVIEVKTISGYT